MLALVNKGQRVQRQQPTLLTKICRRKNTRYWMAPGHLVQDLGEKPLLHLCGLLDESICCRGPLSLAEDSKPLLNSTQFVLELLVECCSRHFLQHSFILLDVLYPLL